VVAPDRLVGVAYRLYDAGGRLVDRVERRRPLRYVHGYAQILPGLEAGLAGARLGERRVLDLGPDEAFGARDEDAVLEIDRADFPEAARVRPGDELACRGDDGAEVALPVLRVTDEDIVVDLNHPLAGQRVRFEAVICSLRPASEDEIDRAQAELDERIAHASRRSSVGPGAPGLVTLRVNRGARAPAANPAANGVG
jgi:FKBP-type peptidyl-prolyl cis-trans isomerase SlyD